MNTKDKLQLLGIQEVTTKRQKANGTREFKLPINDPYGDAIPVSYTHLTLPTNREV